MLSFRIYSVFIVALLLSSCAKTIITQAPPTSSQNNNIAPKYSEVYMPIEISIEGMQKSLNRDLKGVLYQENGLKVHDNVSLDLKVAKQKDIQLKVSGRDIFYSVPLKINLNATLFTETFGVKLSNAQAAQCAIELNFKTKIDVDTLWELSSKTTLLNYTWLEKPTLDFGLFDLPITWIADKIIEKQKKDLLVEIDRVMQEEIKFKSYVESVWKMLQKPIKLNDSPQAWLNIIPKAIYYTPFEGKTGKLASAIGIKTITECVIGSEPKETPKILPPLKIGKRPEGIFIINMTNEISYDDASKLLKDNLMGQEFTFQDGKYKINITDILVYPSNSNLVIKTTMAGSLNGIIYLEGKPVYDTLTKEIRLENAHFNLDTKNALHKMADWMLHGKLETTFQSYLHYPLAQELESAENMIRTQLTNYKITNSVLLNCDLNKIEVNEIILTPTSIKSFMKLDGLLKLKIDGY